jgi:hypothetical protein
MRVVASHHQCRDEDSVGRPSSLQVKDTAFPFAFQSDIVRLDVPYRTEMQNGSGTRWRPASDDRTGNRRTASLAGLTVTLFLLVLALLIARKLQVRCLIEDCVLAGGTKCQQVADKLRVSHAFEVLDHNVRDWISDHQSHN